MKATLHFDLDDGEKEEFAASLEGPLWKQVAQELDRFMRDRLKHGDYAESYYQALTDVRDKLYGILNDEELVLWE